MGGGHWLRCESAGSLHTYVPRPSPPDEDRFYLFKSMDGALQRLGLHGVRMSSDLLVEHAVGGQRPREKIPAAPCGKYASFMPATPVFPLADRVCTRGRGGVYKRSAEYHVRFGRLPADRVVRVPARADRADAKSGIDPLYVREAVAGHLDRRTAAARRSQSTRVWVLRRPMGGRLYARRADYRRHINLTCVIGGLHAHAGAERRADACPEPTCASDALSLPSSRSRLPTRRP